MRKTILLLILIPALLLAGGYLYLRLSLGKAVANEEKKSGKALPVIDSLGGKKVSTLDLRPLFIKRMQQVLNKSSNGLYSLSIKDLEVDVLASSISLQGVSIKPDVTIIDSLRKIKKLPDDVLDLAFDSLRIEGINMDDALTSKTMDYKLVKLVKPVITIRHQKGTIKKEVEEKEDFSQRFLKEMQKLSITNLVVEDGTIHLYSDAKKQAPITLNHVAVHLNDLLLDSLTRTDKQRLLFAKTATLSFRDYVRPSPDGLYKMKIGEVHVQSPENEVRLTNFSLGSPYTKEEFAKRQKSSKELYTLVLPSITISKVNWWALLNEEELTANTVTVPGGKLSIFLDRSLPPVNKTGNFPNQMLMKLPVTMAIGKVLVKDLDFSYGEYSPVSQQSGTIYIDKVNLTIDHLSNVKSATLKPLTVQGDAMLMRQVPVKAEFVFDMAAYRSGNFTAHIKAGGFEGTLFNTFASPMGLLKVEKGTVQSVEATIKGNQIQAHGDVFLPYKDLKLSILEKDKGQAKLDKKDFTTFVANLFVIKDNNPAEGKSSRRAIVDFKRIPEGGFFMLVWKVVLSGILKTIGAPQKIATKTVTTVKQPK